MEAVEAFLVINGLLGLALRVADYYQLPAWTSEEELQRLEALKERLRAVHEEVMAYMPIAIPPSGSG